jgi:hypothetical protein
MAIIRPQIFVSYSRRDEDFVRKVQADLLRSGIDCWMDVTDIQTGDRLNPVIEGAISRSSMFFAYVTKNYLGSRWCMKELEHALKAPGVTVAPYADSKATRDSLSRELMDEVSFGILGPENYVHPLLELAGRAWTSLQTVQRIVPAVDHILAGSAVFDSAGYSRRELMDRAEEELILAGQNLRSWLSDDASKNGMVDLVKRRGVKVTLIMATYETLSPISPEGAIHLRDSVNDIREMITRLEAEERQLMSAHFHIAASTLSAVIVDPKTPKGILFFNPRWAIQFMPQDRLTCVIDKTINSEDLFKAIYNGVFWMTQRDAKSIDDMLAGP